MKEHTLLVAGVMTGNSLDGVDTVLSEFSSDGSIRDVAACFLENPAAMREALRDVRHCVIESDGDVSRAEAEFDKKFSARHGNLQKVHDDYIAMIVRTIRELAAVAGRQPDLIGFHGQTCAHCPPSVAGRKKDQAVYTVQLGNGQALADLSALPVVCDFRSDDIFNGGEGAPLAPLHHEHLVRQPSKIKLLPIIFCNAGNTGNFSLISREQNSGDIRTVGWDTGPFNHFSDLLMKKERGQHCDFDGQAGALGRVNVSLLQALFDKAALTATGSNFITHAPPKSSDPQWYYLIPELTDSGLSFEDRLRTVQYFAVYCLVYNLSMLPANLAFPEQFALCGGGWKNKVVLQHFHALLQRDFSFSPVLPAHGDLFRKILAKTSASSARLSADYGFDDKSMEARIFADAAYSKVIQRAFSGPQTTAASKPCVLGLLKYPGKDPNRAGDSLRAVLKQSGLSAGETNAGENSDPRWSRAVAGWEATIRGQK